MSDIAERLRAYADRTACHDASVTEAADEIERLRAIAEPLQRLIRAVTQVTIEDWPGDNGGRDYIVILDQCDEDENHKMLRHVAPTLAGALAKAEEEIS